MNHLTLCSNSNHLWYPLIVLKSKVHVSFTTFILEDEYRLSLGMLMHVKCIHALCIVLLIFQSYLHHIRVISLFYIDFGNISHFSNFSGINPPLAENPIFYILIFQGPNRRPNDLIFCGDHFLEGTKRRSQGSARKEVWGGFWGGGGMRPDSLATWEHLSPPSLLRCCPFSSPCLRLHLKMTIKIVPRRLSEESAAEIQNHETETWSCRLEGENSGGALPAWSPSSPSTSPPSPWWRGSSPPLDYGFVEVTYVSLSLLSFTN